MKKDTFVIFGALWILLVLTACQPATDEALIDSEIKSYPQRVITLSPHLTELVYSLGAEDKLVATVEYSDCLAGR